jgi:glycerol-3-phosphate cytidylyltransferase
MKDYGGMPRFERAITYGTFDLFHFGHLQLLRRIADLATEVVVAVATDEFNALKGKRAVIPFRQRVEIVGSLRMVDHVISEHTWEQKRDDITTNGIDLLVMGDDWEGRFDDLAEICAVRYLPRTTGISSTSIRTALHQLTSADTGQQLLAVQVVSDVLADFDE